MGFRYAFLPRMKIKKDCLSYGQQTELEQATFAAPVTLHRRAAGTLEKMEKNSSIHFGTVFESSKPLDMGRDRRNPVIDSRKEKCRPGLYRSGNGCQGGRSPLHVEPHPVPR